MLENNPDPKVVEMAKKAIKEAEKAIEDAVRLQGELLRNGAANCEEPEAYEQEGLILPVDDAFIDDTLSASQF